MKGHFLELAIDQFGNLVIQIAIIHSDKSTVKSIVGEMKGHFLELS